MEHPLICREKRPLAIGVVGGSTVVLDIGGLRFLTDPTFNEPGNYGPLTKTEGPAISADALGNVDAVLLSHDQHQDNFDARGREITHSAGRIITTPGAAMRLGGTAVGLATWETVTLARADGGREITIEAVPAIHGPLDGARDESGNVNGEVTGFVLSGEALPTIYVSGDNASAMPILDIVARHPHIDIAVLFAGAARRPSKLENRPLTLTSERAADVAILLGPARIVPAHYQGWSIYSEPLDRLTLAFEDAGIRDALCLAPLGSWSIDEGVEC